MAAPQLIEIARVAGAFGVRGEIRLTTYAADPKALKKYSPLLKASGETGLTITALREHKGGVVVRAKEVETREQAEAMRGLKLYVRREALPDPDEDEFYLADLIGLEARSPEGEVVGRIKAVEDFGAGDILEIAPAAGGPTFYVPFTREAVPEVRIAEGYVLVVRPDEVEAGDARDGAGEGA